MPQISANHLIKKFNKKTLKKFVECVKMTFQKNRIIFIVVHLIYLVRIFDLIKITKVKNVYIIYSSKIENDNKLQSKSNDLIKSNRLYYAKLQESLK